MLSYPHDEGALVDHRMPPLGLASFRCSRNQSTVERHYAPRVLRRCARGGLPLVYPGRTLSTSCIRHLILLKLDTTLLLSQEELTELSAEVARERPQWRSWKHDEKALKEEVAQVKVSGIRSSRAS